MNTPKVTWSPIWFNIAFVYFSLLAVVGGVFYHVPAIACYFLIGVGALFALIGWIIAVKNRREVQRTSREGGSHDASLP